VGETLGGQERAEGVKRLIVTSLFSSTDQPPSVNDSVFDRRERRNIEEISFVSFE
jgi:hypothetical protein